MDILLQNKGTRDYVQDDGGWTEERGKARLFSAGVEAIYFCLNRHISNMQIVGEFADARMNFVVPVTDRRGD